MEKLEWLWPYPQELKVTGEFPAPREISFTGAGCPEHLAEDVKQIARIKVTESGSFSIRLASGDANIKPEGYRLSLSASEGAIKAADEAGLSYGLQTFLQIISLCRDGRWPELKINDGPAYRKRCFMVDMGRSVFSMPMLKRIIRILNRLKMNQLHLHLYDDQLCGVRFNGLPFGHENPYAISLNDLAELVRYAARYHVEIVPELEGWAHTGSIVYHRKELRSGDGTCGGSSFLICEETFALMKELLRQVVEVMPGTATIHLGLDEAIWFLAPSMPKEFALPDMDGRYYDMLQELGTEYNKKLSMRIWADHSGRVVPERIQKNVIMEPWQYWNVNTPKIDVSIERYSGMEGIRWMGAGGVSGAQHRGAFHATRYWAQHALKSPNVDGINVTFWCWNDIDRKFMSLFAGAYYIWNPSSPAQFADVADYEMFDRYVFPIMYWWQNTFKDASPDNLQQDRGPLVHSGLYVWGPKHGQPVAPTVLAANTNRVMNVAQE